MPSVLHYALDAHDNSALSGDTVFTRCLLAVKAPLVNTDYELLLKQGRCVQAATSGMQLLHIVTALRLLLALVQKLLRLLVEPTLQVQLLLCHLTFNLQNSRRCSLGTVDCLLLKDHIF